MFDEIPKDGLDPNALKVFKIYGLINYFFVLLPAPAFFIVSHFFGPFPQIIGWLLAGITIASAYPIIWMAPNISFERWRYEIKEHEIDIRKGLLIVRRTLIPIIRIQHVETTQGPILKRYNLSSLSVSTAARAHSIPALRTDIATGLKIQISNLARLSEEDV